MSCLWHSRCSGQLIIVICLTPRTTNMLSTLYALTLSYPWITRGLRNRQKSRPVPFLIRMRRFSNLSTYATGKPDLCYAPVWFSVSASYSVSRQKAAPL
ncbi:hypothetical protein DFH11DRAFT_1607449 [Phellopilus nigrolimitatus]|nr:hypothetical protein DFH11DRAFT_1607449 [Phellopilus nigrolimitatus]